MVWTAIWRTRTFLIYNQRGKGWKEGVELRMVIPVQSSPLSPVVSHSGLMPPTTTPTPIPSCVIAGGTSEAVAIFRDSICVQPAAQVSSTDSHQPGWSHHRDQICISVKTRRFTIDRRHRSTETRHTEDGGMNKGHVDNPCVWDGYCRRGAGSHWRLHTWSNSVTVWSMDIMTAGDWTD